MPDLNSFIDRIERRLAKADRDPQWSSEDTRTYMSAVSARQTHFSQLAEHLMGAVLRPRLEALANSFLNAAMADNDVAHHCTAWFGYCDRFPATTRVELAVEHDARFKSLSVLFEARMMPRFVKFNEHDRFSMSLQEVHDDSIGLWAENNLLEFLDSYLQIDRGSELVERVPALDPVCGMEISEDSAAANASYCGHPYFFCSVECKKRFQENPTAFVAVGPSN